MDEVDRLSIVSHDKYEAIVNLANDPNSLVRRVYYIDPAETSTSDEQRVTVEMPTTYDELTSDTSYMEQLALTFVQESTSRYGAEQTRTQEQAAQVASFVASYASRSVVVTNDDKVYILQVRPISIKGRKIRKLNLDTALLKIHQKIDKLQAENPNVFGERAIFGVMPDWNPAEMIGIRPKKLALSLYKELITDNIWAYQRDNYGYLNLRSHPLLISFLGVPFIDVRTDFNSFIPKKNP